MSEVSVTDWYASQADLHGVPDKKNPGRYIEVFDGEFGCGEFVYGWAASGAYIQERVESLSRRLRAPKSPTLFYDRKPDA